jgi:hypothetical protein
VEHVNALREKCIDLMLNQVVHILTAMLQSIETTNDAEFKVLSPDWVKEAGAVIHSSSEI